MPIGIPSGQISILRLSDDSSASMRAHSTDDGLFPAGSPIRPQGASYSPIKIRPPKKVPVVIQIEALECGAACLAMILAYYEKWIPLEQVRSDCGVSRDGSKAGKIMRAARNYGFEAKGYKYEAKNLIIKEKALYPLFMHLIYIISPHHYY